MQKVVEHVPMTLYVCCLGFAFVFKDVRFAGGGMCHTTYSALSGGFLDVSGDVLPVHISQKIKMVFIRQLPIMFGIVLYTRHTSAVATVCLGVACRTNEDSNNLC